MRPIKVESTTRSGMENTRVLVRTVGEQDADPATARTVHYLHYSTPYRLHQCTPLELALAHQKCHWRKLRLMPAEPMLDILVDLVERANLS